MPQQRRNQAEHSFVRRVLETRKFAVGDYQPGPRPEQHTLNLAAPVFDERGGIIRIMFSALDLGVLQIYFTLPKISSSPPSK